MCDEISICHEWCEGVYWAMKVSIPISFQFIQLSSCGERERERLAKKLCN